MLASAGAAAAAAAARLLGCSCAVMTPGLAATLHRPCKMIYPELVKMSGELEPRATIVKFNW